MSMIPKKKESKKAYLSGADSVARKSLRLVDVACSSGLGGLDILLAFGSSGARSLRELLAKRSIAGKVSALCLWNKSYQIRSLSAD
jgi:hypothetical protein